MQLSGLTQARDTALAQVLTVQQELDSSRTQLEVARSQLLRVEPVLREIESIREQLAMDSQQLPEDILCALQASRDDLLRVFQTASQDWASRNEQLEAQSAVATARVQDLERDGAAKEAEALANVAGLEATLRSVEAEKEQEIAESQAVIAAMGARFAEAEANMESQSSALQLQVASLQERASQAEADRSEQLAQANAMEQCIQLEAEHVSNMQSTIAALELRSRELSEEATAGNLRVKQLEDLLVHTQAQVKCQSNRPEVNTADDCSSVASNSAAQPAEHYEAVLPTMCVVQI